MEDDGRIEPRRGVYDTRRASALSGVPYRTLNYWAQKQVYLPSIDPVPYTRLWSWGDLLAVRAIYWFRQGSGDPENGTHIRPVPMAQVRDMLAMIERAGQSREQLSRLVAVAEDGRLFLQIADDPLTFVDQDGQMALPHVLRLVAPFGEAPDLLTPRELVRIRPGKLHGEPHVVGTRISTSVLYQLSEMGYPREDIREMYPDVTLRALSQSIELENKLQRVA